VRRRANVSQDQSDTNNHQPPIIDTYDDHRMAMAFAPVGMVMPISIAEPGVVAKSYPTFWDDVKKITQVVETTLD
jgi:3-phosphoshikimate 1-carboxyvinyltransferase